MILLGYQMAIDGYLAGFIVGPIGTWLIVSEINKQRKQKEEEQNERS